MACDLERLGVWACTVHGAERRSHAIGANPASSASRRGFSIHLHAAPPGWGFQDLPPDVVMAGADGPVDVIVASTGPPPSSPIAVLWLHASTRPARGGRRGSGAGGCSSDITDGVRRARGLAHGIVDVKVAAIDQDWSACAGVATPAPLTALRGRRQPVAGFRCDVDVARLSPSQRTGSRSRGATKDEV
jgi:hypothetical protein